MNLIRRRLGGELFRRLRVGEVRDQRIETGPALGRENRGDGAVVRRIAAKSVDISIGNATSEPLRSKSEALLMSSRLAESRAGTEPFLDLRRIGSGSLRPPGFAACRRLAPPA